MLLLSKAKKHPLKQQVASWVPLVRRHQLRSPCISVCRRQFEPTFGTGQGPAGTPCSQSSSDSAHLGTPSFVGLGMWTTQVMWLSSLAGGRYQGLPRYLGWRRQLMDPSATSVGLCCVEHTIASVLLKGTPARCPGCGLCPTTLCNTPFFPIYCYWPLTSLFTGK